MLRKVTALFPKEALLDWIKETLFLLQGRVLASSLMSRDQVEAICQTGSARATLSLQTDINMICLLLKDTRVSAGLTQKELAQRSGISRATIANIELCAIESGPTVSTVIRLLRACGKRAVPMLLDTAGDVSDINSGEWQSLLSHFDAQPKSKKNVKPPNIPQYFVRVVSDREPAENN